MIICPEFREAIFVARITSVKDFFGFEGSPFIKNRSYSFGSYNMGRQKFPFKSYIYFKII